MDILGKSFLGRRNKCKGPEVRPYLVSLQYKQESSEWNGMSKGVRGRR